MITIRPGTPADRAAVSAVYRAASLNNPGDRDILLAHPEYLVLGPEGLAEGRTHVAEEDGVIVGFATWAETGGDETDGDETEREGTGGDETDGELELEDLFVDPGWMRRGIATALVSRIADVARSRGARTLAVIANPHALAFYRSAGFVDDSRVIGTTLGRGPRMLLPLG